MCQYPGCTKFEISLTKINFALPFEFCDEHYKIILEKLENGVCLFCYNQAHCGFAHDGNLLLCGYHAGKYYNKTGHKLVLLRNVTCVDSKCGGNIARYGWPGNTNPKYCEYHADSSMSKLF